jgi:hypothetical protein
MKVRQWPYRRRQGGEIKWYPHLDLLALLAKELGLSRPHKRRLWIVIPLSIGAFVVGLTIVAPEDLTIGFAPSAETIDRHELSERIAENRHIQIAEVAMSGFSRTKGLALDWSNTSLISIGVMFNRVAASPASPATRSTLPPERQLVQEFWRSFAYSTVADRYEYYLRNYPSGAFADIATARLNELRKIIPQEVTKLEASATQQRAIVRSAASLRPRTLIKPNAIKRKTATPSAETRTRTKVVIAGTAERKESVSLLAIRRPEKSVKETAIPGKVLIKKTEGRCWGRNIEQCKERCREGDARACQKLKRLGD